MFPFFFLLQLLYVSSVPPETALYKDVGAEARFCKKREKLTSLVTLVHRGNPKLAKYASRFFATTRCYGYWRGCGTAS